MSRPAGHTLLGIRLLPAAGLVLFSLAGPAAAADLQLDNVRLDFGKFSLSFPRLDVKGTSLDRAGFLALVQGGSGESAVARLGKLDASEITAPALVMVQDFGTQKQTTTYRDVRFSDIKAGRVARGESTGGSIKVEGGPNPMTGEIKRTSFDTLDLTQIARVFGEKAAPGTEAPMAVLLGRFEQEGYALDLGESGKITGGRNTIRDFKGRPTAVPLSEAMTDIVVLGEQADKAAKDLNSKEEPEVTRERDRKLATALFGLLQAFDYGSGEMRDLVMDMKAPPKPGAKPEAVSFSFARIAFGEETPDKSGLVLEGMRFAAGGAKGSIDSIGYSGFSFGNVLNDITASLSQPDFSWSTADYRRFIPKLGKVRLSGISMTVPQDGKRGRPAGEPMQIGLGTFEIKAGEQLNGIPTSLGLTLDRLTVPVVESPTNPAARDLIAMGYKVLDLSAGLDLGWQEATKELAIRTLSIGGAGMGSISATGTLGNIGKEVFSGDLALAQVALLGASAKSLDIKVENTGLADKLIANEARKSASKPEEVRAQYGAIASLGLASILGPSDGAKALANAVARFVAKPGTLSVKATAKAPTGLGLADVITVDEPSQIFDKVDVSADAK